VYNFDGMCSQCVYVGNTYIEEESTSNVSLITLHVSGVGMLTLHAETPVIGVTKVRYIQ